jgi:hypothetical protein
MLHSPRRPLCCGLVPILLVAASFTGFGVENRYNIFIPYVPTPDHVVERMLELAGTGKDDLVLDMGSGDGRIVVMAAKKFGARARGVEIDPKLVKEAEENAAKAGVSERTSFVAQDMFITPIADASVVTLYVLTAVNLELRPRLLAELKPGTRVVSHAFSMGGWLADKQENFRGIDLYMWVVPAQVGGQWRMSDGSRDFTLSIEQQYQEIKGTASFGRNTVPLRQATLNGDQIDFAIDFGFEQPTWFRGRVSEGVMEPRGAAGDMGRNWKGNRVSLTPLPGK